MGVDVEKVELIFQVSYSIELYTTSWVLISKIFECKIVTIFLSLCLKYVLGAQKNYLNEAFLFEYSHHVLRNKKLNF